MDWGNISEHLNKNPDLLLNKLLKETSKANKQQKEFDESVVIYKRSLRDLIEVFEVKNYEPTLHTGENHSENARAAILKRAHLLFNEMPNHDTGSVDKDPAFFQKRTQESMSEINRNETEVARNTQPNSFDNYEISNLSVIVSMTAAGCKRFYDTFDKVKEKSEVLPEDIVNNEELADGIITASTKIKQMKQYISDKEVILEHLKNNKAASGITTLHPTMYKKESNLLNLMIDIENIVSQVPSEMFDNSFIKNGNDHTP